MSVTEVKVPDIGDFKDVAVIEVLVKPGDTIQADQSLVTVESDKASMEIPSSHAGVVKELKVKVGDTVNEGTLLALVETTGAAVSSPPPPGEGRVGATPAAAVPPPQPSPKGGGSEALPAPVASSYAGGADLECEMLVLGAGPGGYSAAFRAADLGMKPCWSSATPRWAVSA
jgi:dihydrolipoamide dehydrogenase